MFRRADRPLNQYLLSEIAQQRGGRPGPYRACGSPSPPRVPRPLRVCTSRRPRVAFQTRPTPRSLGRSMPCLPLGRIWNRAHPWVRPSAWACWPAIRQQSLRADQRRQVADGRIGRRGSFMQSPRIWRGFPGPCRPAGRGRVRERRQTVPGPRQRRTGAIRNRPLASPADNPPAPGRDRGRTAAKAGWFARRPSPQGLKCAANFAGSRRNRLQAFVCPLSRRRPGARRLTRAWPLWRARAIYRPREAIPPGRPRPCRTDPECPYATPLCLSSSSVIFQHRRGTAEVRAFWIWGSRAKCQSVYC